MRILITGATGFIGMALSWEAKRRGHEVVALSRDPVRAKDVLREIRIYPWEPQAGPPPSEALAGIEAVVHLAGENIGARRWTRKRMASIRDSRIVGTRNLVKALTVDGPQVLVCASAVGWYGDRGDEIVKEGNAPAHDFLAELCREWEAEAAMSREVGARWVSIRNGVVLGRDGGALQAMLPAFKANVGGPMAGGRQWMSWIHIDDLVALYLFAVENGKLAGPVNGTAPHPVTNRDFAKTLGLVLGKWSFMPMPRLALRIAVGKVARYLTASQRCEPAAAIRAGFVFKYPELGGALRQILGVGADRREIA